PHLLAGQRPPLLRGLALSSSAYGPPLLGGGKVLLCYRGKAILFLRIEPSSLCDRPDMSCSVCLAGPPARSGVRPASCFSRRPAKPYRCTRRAAGMPPRDAIDAAATGPGPGSLPARTAPPEETRRAGSAPVIPVPAWANVRG